MVEKKTFRFEKQVDKSITKFDQNQGKKDIQVLPDNMAMNYSFSDINHITMLLPRQPVFLFS